MPHLPAAVTCIARGYKVILARPHRLAWAVFGCSNAHQTWHVIKFLQRGCMSVGVGVVGVKLWLHGSIACFYFPLVAQTLNHPPKTTIKHLILAVWTQPQCPIARGRVFYFPRSWVLRYKMPHFPKTETAFDSVVCSNRISFFNLCPSTALGECRIENLLAVDNTVSSSFRKFYKWFLELCPPVHCIIITFLFYSLHWVNDLPRAFHEVRNIVCYRFT